MDATSDSVAFNPATQPLTFAARTLGSGVYDSHPLSSMRRHDPLEDSKEASCSFEMGHEVSNESGSDAFAPQTITVRTTTTTATPATRVPAAASASPSSAACPLARPAARSARVHVDPHRSHTVAAAAAAKKKAEEEAAVEPLTAENESWGHWSFRHVFNGFIMMLQGFYQVVQVGARRLPADMKTITYTNSVYMPAPPREEELKKQQQQGGGGHEGTA